MQNADVCMKCRCLHQVPQPAICTYLSNRLCGKVTTYLGRYSTGICSSYQATTGSSNSNSSSTRAQRDLSNLQEGNGN